ncbi:hypothetical protein WIW50_02740 [Flavobacteriaceae bacterium 3-367]
MKKLFTLKILLIFFAFIVGCKECPNPPAGTIVEANSVEFQELAKKINPNLDCARIDCCTMDGVETSCALVNACLEAGFCEVVATAD